MEFKSTYNTLRERLIKEEKLTAYTADRAFRILSDLNAQMAVGEAEIKKKKFQAEQELSVLYINS